MTEKPILSVEELEELIDFLIKKEDVWKKWWKNIRCV